MEFNFIKIIFALAAMYTAIISVSLKLIEDYIPLFIRRAFRYGKYAEKTDHKIMKLFEVPKRYFKHFYAFSAPLLSIILIITINRYLFNSEVPAIVYKILDILLGPSRSALVSSEATMIALFLTTGHCWKRFYETHFVNVFSNAKINLSHYIIGFIHYIGVVTCIIGESHGFISSNRNDFDWRRITYFQLICVCIFIMASREQLQTNYILANLRKDKNGNVVTISYKKPQGRLYNYISSPLQFTEIVTYTTLSLILWNSSSFHYVTIWVLANQIGTAFLDDQWYKKTYKDCDKHRKILIPFLI
ncbi:polyprenol reductase-like [Chelonus insularis]|uniref:polyprenol reductase-like n=1 Tax=Chelonus insularis TaxID=460826 RepID=UPI00158D76C1|nr:polyprenol reductase-like [Chelonus insularis]XP_034943829.1 polyprenol reductase-like [Chelonus insularis]XP_034943830.1 polyprenol reductase-like [Chelonus insularis]